MDDFVYGEPAVVAGEGTTFEKGLGEFDAHAPVGPPGGFTRGPGRRTADPGGVLPRPDHALDRTLVKRTAFTVPANATTPRLRFRHYYRLEGGFDGGVLEVTTNKGKTWTSPPPGQYVTNPPDRTLQGSNPLAGTLAWSGAEERPVELSVLDSPPTRARASATASAWSPTPRPPRRWRASRTAGTSTTSSSQGCRRTGLRSRVGRARSDHYPGRP